jgi:nucleotide-binding universal stress UspA family protein
MCEPGPAPRLTLGETHMDSGRVIVGIDGSAPSRAALRWATLDASRRGTTLSVLSAYTGVIFGIRPIVSPELERAQRKQAERTVQEALANAREVGPELAIDGRPVLGDPAGVLLDASHSASCLVVGGHGRGRLAGLLAGSVSQQVALHARCPVAIVRGRSDAADGPVVVGVDGSASSHLAVDLAFEQAAARGCAVTIVFAYEGPFTGLGAEAAAPFFDDEQLRADVERDFSQAVARWRDQHRAVQVDQTLATGQAGSILVDLSHEAQLVVVGSRGRGGFAGLLLGSVGMHLLHQADCPVLIAHGGRDGS